MELIEEKHIFKSFLFFYKLKYKGETRKYDPLAIKQCTNFLERLKKQFYHLEALGVDFLWDYFLFQYAYWENCDVKAFENRITLAMMIGSKALQRYNDRETKYDFLLQKKSSTFDKTEFENTVFLYRQKKSSTYDPDEMYRSQLLNTETGLSNCIVYTSLYHPDSKSCQVCKYKSDCIETQKQMYRKIYRNRKIENGKQQTTTR